MTYPAPQVTYHYTGRPWWALWRRDGYWVLSDPWQCGIDGHLIKIPAGFKFDIASIPRVFWPIAGPLSLSLPAPLAHDFFYRFRDVDRKTADRLFRRIMMVEGVGWVRRWVGWGAVRLFGWFAYRCG